MSHYDTLEVSPQASPEVIRAAYKSLMQRFHPDKHPGNGAMAERAGLITLAYDTVSDSARRSAYDQSLKAARQTDSPSSQAAPGRSRPLRPSPRHAAAGQHSAMAFFWGIVVVIVVAGGLSLWLLKSNAGRKTQPPQPAQQSQDRSSVGAIALDTGTTQHTSGNKAGKGPLFVRLGTHLQVMVGGGGSDPGRVYALTIPNLQVQIGRTDANEFTRYLVQQESALLAHLVERLAVLAQPDELIKASGRQYLRQLIVEALVDITGTDAGKAPALPRAGTASPDDASAAYGVIGVAMPDGFTLR